LQYCSAAVEQTYEAIVPDYWRSIMCNETDVDDSKYESCEHSGFTGALCDDCPMFNECPDDD